MWAAPAANFALPLTNDLEALRHLTARRGSGWPCRFFERAVLVPSAETPLLGDESPRGNTESDQHRNEHHRERCNAVNGAVHHTAPVV
jgi:hypothetical protein